MIEMKTADAPPVEEKDNSMVIIIIVVIVIVLLLIAVAICAYCIYKNKTKQKVEVDRGELQLHHSTDEENPEIIDSSKNLLNDSMKKKQASDLRQSTGDLEFANESGHRLTTVHNENAELMAECPEDSNEESLRNEEDDVYLKSVEKMQSPKQ